MSDAASPQPAQQPTSSVVIETNSRVAVPKWPLWSAAGVVAALAVFTVVWFATNGEDSYTPGPVVQALQESAAEAGLELDLPAAEARCIDDAGERYDITAEMIRESGGDVLSPMPTENQAAFATAMMQDCMSHDTRARLIATSLLSEAGGAITDEQAECLGGAVDDLVIEAGGYAELMENPDAMGMELGMAMFTAFEDCGISFEDLMAMDA